MQHIFCISFELFSICFPKQLFKNIFDMQEEFFYRSQQQKKLLPSPNPNTASLGANFFTHFFHLSVAWHWNILKCIFNNYSKDHLRFVYTYLYILRFNTAVLFFEQLVLVWSTLLSTFQIRKMHVYKGSGSLA